MQTVTGAIVSTRQKEADMGQQHASRRMRTAVKVVGELDTDVFELECQKLADKDMLMVYCDVVYMPEPVGAIMYNAIFAKPEVVTYDKRQ